MGAFEDQLVRSFGKIESVACKAISSIVNGSGEETSLLIGKIQEALISYSKMLIEHLGTVKDSYSQIPEDQMYRAAFYKERINIIPEVVKLLETMCEDLYSISMETDQLSVEKIQMFKSHEGLMALLLRYEILSDDDITEEESIVKAFALLNDMSNYTQDYYPIHIIRNRSNRRYMPRSMTDEVAIILQGQIVYDKDFTLETVYRYRYLYPNVPIIVSTWKGEVENDFKWKAESIDVIVIENDYPAESGENHINYQLCNSCNGVRYAKEHYAVKYALKCRTDQRFYLPDFIDYLKDEVILFPVKDSLKSRIVFQGCPNSMLLYPFRITDFWAFGSIDDLILFYSAPYNPKLDNRGTYKKVVELVPYENGSVYKNMNEEERYSHVENLNEYPDCETYITRSFYERCILGRPLNKEMDDVMMHYWNYIKDYIIIEDQETLLMYWQKYTWPKYNFDCCILDGMLTHSAWLGMYMRDLR